MEKVPDSAQPKVTPEVRWTLAPLCDKKKKKRERRRRKKVACVWEKHAELVLFDNGSFPFSHLFLPEGHSLD